jgi:hypothetical protein
VLGLRRVAIFAAGAHFLLGVAHSEERGPGFRRFADTISPNGAYVLGWGWGEEKGRLEALKEWPPDGDTAGDSVANYLVNAVQGRVIATIPERDHYEGTPGFKRFSGLAVGWAQDSRRALAIYEGRWSDEAILWINPETRTEADAFIDVLAPLEAAYRRWLAQQEKVSEAGEIAFSLPALLPGDVLMIDARARPQVNKPLEYNHRLKFLLKLDGGKARCTLVSGRKISDASANYSDDRVEEELNKVYQRLRARLDDPGRAALKATQLQLLKQRQALIDAGSNGRFFTRLRTAYLRARVEED